MNAVITGASSGIGLATAKLLCDRGWKVSGLSRHAPDWQHNNFMFVECDVSSWESVQKAKKQVTESIDLLVLNAGVYLKKPLIELSEEEYDKTMDVNVKGVYLVIKAFLDSMLERGSGSIVTVSSKAGLGPGASAPVYVASKHAVQGYMNSIRGMCAEKGVKISLVCPGGVDTPIRDQQRKDYLVPEAIADTILFIAERRDNTIIDQIELEPVVQAEKGFN